MCVISGDECVCVCENSEEGASSAFVFDAIVAF